MTFSLSPEGMECIPHSTYELLTGSCKVFYPIQKLYISVEYVDSSRFEVIDHEKSFKIS